MDKSKEVLTTGQVAKICNVAPRTVSKWFDSGQLRGYRIPGSKDRRIPVHELVRFMRAYGMPLNGLDTGQRRVLIVDDERELVELLTTALSRDPGYEVRTAGSAFEAGVVAQGFMPHIIVVDVSLPDVNPQSLCRLVRGDASLEETQLIAVSGGMTEGTGQGLVQEGFNGYLRKPFDVRELVEAIEGVLTAVS